MKINPSKAYSQINKTYSNDSTKESVKPTLPKQGEVVKGEIIDLQHSSIKIKLTNGQVIEAKMTEAFEFFIGQKLEFFVKESGLEQILLKPILAQANNSESKLIQILENAGITVNQENLDVVARLLENNMPVDKETLLKIIPYTKQFNTSIDEILFMVKNNIPVTKDNIEQLTNMIKNNNKIVQNLAAISDDLSLLVKDGVGYEMAKVLLQDNQLSQEVLEHLRQQILTLTLAADKQQINQPILKEQQQVQQPLQSQQPQQSQQIMQQELQVNAPKEQIDHQNTVVETLWRSLDNKNSAVNNEIKLDFSLDSLLSHKQIESLDSDIINASKNEPNNGKLSLNHKTINELFDELNTLKFSPELKEKITNLITSKITYTLFSKALFASEKHLESPEQLKQFYENLHEKVVKLAEMGSQNVGDKTNNLSKDAHQVKNAIEFINDLNQRFNYIQVPMLFGDQLLHSELYILNDKRKIKGDKGTLTALIRLDMVNLGHLDIYVTKSDKNVTIQFFTEEESKNTLIENKVFAIHNQLGKLGFKVLGISVSKKEKEFNVVEDFLKREEIHEVKRYTFDMRA